MLWVIRPEIPLNPSNWPSTMFDHENVGGPRPRQPVGRISRQHSRDRGAHATKQPRGRRIAILEVEESQIAQVVGMRWQPALQCSVWKCDFYRFVGDAAAEP